MKKPTTIIIALLIVSGQSLLGQLGQAIVTYQPIYEEVNNYFPHDHFIELDMHGLLDSALTIRVNEGGLVITNNFNNGFSGHSVIFTISKSLEIEDVKYDTWTDMIDGSETKYTVEKAILSMNENPFTSEMTTVYYTLQIKQAYSAAKLLRNEGVNDTATFNTFNGKFKLYSEKEKQKARDWNNDQNEIKMVIKDSNDLYLRPDEYAKYTFGDDSLKAILVHITIDRAETEVNGKSFVILSMVVDIEGNVPTESMYMREPIKSGKVLERIKQNEQLTTNWIPATYKGKAVKSEINLPIMLK